MEHSIFNFNLKVRDYECDAQGIVNNANYQHYYEVCRHEFLEYNGLNFYELHTQGIDLVLVSIFVKYSNSLKGGDLLACTIDSIEKEGIRYFFNQKIIRLSDNKICSEARAEVVTLVKGHVSLPAILDKTLSQYLK
ncbi:acyl-CoA thioesterase [Apibacter adventoris]|uniref:Thioesterase n=1 Tax=Apibacter adventoris TaxID=1679466 RepID=A0A2S8AE45_9FLAO|nr:acyl-CoA thioesterase [Apibacter adventoris]PQL93209.1 thioesterase [Apibacter adventoris]